MNVRFASSANLELDQAIRYYDHQLPGLGFRFFREVEAAVDRIRAIPEAWTIVGKHTRRCIVKGFPYALLYAVNADEILITAVAHFHRDPEHYKDRIV